MNDELQWRVIASSVVGRSHLDSQRGCEDAFYPHDVSTLDDTTLIIAVADGLGSAKFAAKGAQFAVEKAVTLLHAYRNIHGDTMNPSTIAEIFASVRQELILMADTNHVDVNDYACTLQLVALNSSQLVGGHIGDGLILGVRHPTRVVDDNVVDILSVMPPTTKLSEYDYDNATHTVVGPHLTEHLRMFQIDQHNFDRYDGVMLMTDGTQSLCFVYETKQLLQPFFVELINWANQNHEVSVTEMNHQLSQFFLSDDVRRQTRDDITLVFARHHSR